MDKQLRNYYLAFIILTLIPLLIIFPLSLIEYFGENSAVLSSLSIFSLLPLVIYYFQSRRAIQDKGDFTMILRITFYVNFLLYMFTILIAFYFLIIGGFLFTDQVPIGLSLEQWQAPYLIGMGFYLIIISGLGMVYLTKSKKILST